MRPDYVPNALVGIELAFLELIKRRVGLHCRPMISNSIRTLTFEKQENTCITVMVNPRILIAKYMPYYLFPLNINVGDSLKPTGLCNTCMQALSLSWYYANIHRDYKHVLECPGTPKPYAYIAR